MQTIAVWRRMTRQDTREAKQLGAELEADEDRADAPPSAAPRRTFFGWVRDWFSALTIAGCVAGGLIGFAAREAGLSADEVKLLGYVGELFVRSLKATLSPMIFASMICCMNIHAGGQASAATPRLAVLFYALTTCLASTTGVLAFLVVRPGGAFDAAAPPPPRLDGAALERGDHARVLDTLLALGRELVPNNVLKALVEMELLSVITSGVALGVAIRHTAAIHPDATAPMLALAKGTFETILVLIGWLVLLAPLGVASMVASCVAATPDLAAVAGSLGLLVACTVAASLVHVLGSLALVLALAAPRRNAWRYLRGMSPAASMAFGTASSAATLSTTMEAVVAQGVRRAVANFVLPLGATINMDGSALGITISVLFLANTNGQLGAMNAVDVANVGFVSALLSVGAAPVPSSGLITLLLCMEATGVEVGAMTAYVLAIDWLLDRVRTTVNVLSDAMVCACVDGRVPDDERETPPAEVELRGRPAAQGLVVPAPGADGAGPR